jgi:hypothetical protein
MATSAGQMLYWTLWEKYFQIILFRSPLIMNPLKAKLAGLIFKYLLIKWWFYLSIGKP